MKKKVATVIEFSRKIIAMSFGGHQRLTEVKLLLQ